MIVSDGAGGIIAVWNDYRYGTSSPFDKSDVFAQRLDSFGFAQWTRDGVPICIANDQSPITPIPPAIVSDGAGGAIVAWHDFRGGKWTIYAQRINSSGTVLWRTNGVAFSFPSAAGPWVQLYPPSIVADGSGGAILAWGCYLDGIPRGFAQRINGTGTLQWDSMGVSICDTFTTVVQPSIISDGIGGSILAWSDESNGPGIHIRTQRIDSSGALQWTSRGRAIHPMYTYQVGFRFVSDDSGGAIFIWTDRLNGTATLYAQHVVSSGEEPWGVMGVTVTTTSSPGQSQSLLRDLTGDLIVAWTDIRSENSEIYCQKLDVTGSMKWKPGGVAISTNVINDYHPQLLSDSDGNIIIAWKASDGGCYSQMINDSSVVQWDSSGVLLCNTSNSLLTPLMTKDEAGGAIIAWEDYRNSFFADIYAQQISADGILGFVPTEVIQNDAHPSMFRLNQNYPNPFNPVTTISFELPHKAFVSLKVFNLMGQNVATLISAELPAGEHSRQWNTVGISSGIYIYRLQIGEHAMTKKMVVLR